MKSNNIKRRTAILTLFSVLLLTVAFVFPSQVTAVSDSKSKQMEADIQKLKEDEAAVKSKLASLKATEADQYALKEALEEQIRIKEEEIRQYNALIAALSDSVSGKQAEIEERQSELDTKFGQFKKRLAVSYEEGQQGYLGMLLSSESISDFFINAEMMNSMLDHDTAVMRELNESMRVLSEEKEALLEETAKQEQYRNELAAAEKELENKRAEVSNLIYQLQKQEKDAESKIAALQAEQKKADAELQEYLKKLSQMTGGSFTQGTLSWPIGTGSQFYNYISSPFGPRTYMIYGRWVSDSHYGIDIPVRTGTPVYAAGDGKVVKALYLTSSYGTYVVVDHGGGISTVYAHCSSLNVKEGDTVKRGQQIAVSGATGNVTGPHLHFEYRINGKAVDPLAEGRVSHPEKLIYT